MKVLLLELNEFNEDLLREAGKMLHLRNVNRLLAFHKSITWTEDLYESGFLEPWVQWVSVHTGVPSSHHQVKHLGDLPRMQIGQLWEKLSEKGISSGIWGAMNARRGTAANCFFFFPDPWATSENSFPSELDALLYPLRHASKNYTNFSLSILFRQIGKLFKLIQANRLRGCLAKELLSLAKSAAFYRAKPFVFISFLDFLSTRLFLKYRERLDPDFSLLFLNSIAHLQHHQWKYTITTPLAHGFKNIDRILGHIFKKIKPDDFLIVANALSQKNTGDEKPWILYRQRDQKKFLQSIGIEDAVIESHMTHDAHLFFPSASAAQRAREILQSASVEGSPLFHVESYEDHPLKLFYRIQLTDPLPKEACLNIFGKTYRFFHLFMPIVRRTGKHIQRGAVFCNRPLFPAEMANHEIGNRILEICAQNCQRKEPVSPQSR